MKHKPNTKLPKGGKLLAKELVKSVGGWSQMSFDASVERFGITWLRVKNGMGERGDREDWVGDVSGATLCVHDYHWNGDSFGPNYGSFDGALKAQTLLTMSCLRRGISALTQELNNKNKGLLILKRSVKNRRLKQHPNQLNNL